MAPRSDSADRLLSSLECLEQQLPALIAAEAWPDLAQLLEREEAVVAGLLAALHDPQRSPTLHASLQERLHRFLRLQAETQDALTSAMRRTSEELQDLRRSQASVRAARPRYSGDSDRSAPRFTAIG
jgi:hypothetical protein